jgi:ABC-type branched-subunit amino acid transport system ATPase component
MIKLSSVSKFYRTKELETVALDTVDLEIEQGEFVAVMGPSGCGKSTLLNIIGLIDAPTNGEYFFWTDEVSQYSEKRLAKIRKGNVGFIFQSFNLGTTSSSIFAVLRNQPRSKEVTSADACGLASIAATRSRTRASVIEPTTRGNASNDSTSSAAATSASLFMGLLGKLLLRCSTADIHVPIGGTWPSRIIADGATAVK